MSVIPGRSVLRSAPLRLLCDRDLDEVLALLAGDPVGNVFVASRIEAGGLDAARLGAEVWGWAPDRRLEALCYSGANLVPAGVDGLPREAAHAALRAFSDRARRQGRRCSSIVGPYRPVEGLWSLLRRDWSAPREVRMPQPLLAIAGAPLVPPDPQVHRVRPDELDTLLPAAVAMFREEVGVSPTAGDGGALYRSRVAELIGHGRSFARIEGARVLFKAELGAVTRAACQVQGVWVHPDLRGQGLGTAGMAAVVAESLRSVAPVVSLYVNAYNAPARASYARVGFTEVGAFGSVLF